MTPTETPSLVLAHLSDVHLPPPAPLPSWPHFTNKRALSVASWKRHRVHHHLPALSDAVRDDMQAARPDLILNTGDLTNFGLREEFSNAASWLGTMKAPCLVVPGNHDAMVREPWQETTAQWSDWMENSAEGAFPYLREEGDLAIIGVNSAVPTPPFMACGHVGAAQRVRLATLLDATRDRCRVIMIHHPPRTGLVPWRKSLLDLKAVADIIAQHGAAMVLHGHSHDATLSTIPGTSIPLIGVPSASLQSAKPWRHSGWNRIAIARHDAGWEIDLTTRQFTQETGWRCSRHRNWLIRDGQG
ncbi:metallophosphoesterase family protein [Asaia platycodi]|uniref:metallophosphoesterase family protein n=1 Tax=Asaia platycodi TaxID=610243 RepID=UPI0009DE0C38|nr:metallophosphoesterase [Asaia platycodi]